MYSIDLNRWAGSLAVVTGASSGIGAAICEKFINVGINVVGMSRRVQLIQEMSDRLSTDQVKLHPICCDVSDEKSVLDAFAWIDAHIGGISILVNNAGVLLPTTIIDGDTEMWKKTLDVNFLGLSICTREGIKSMKKYKINGQIINMNSIAGHFVPFTEVPCLNMYSPSKHAVTAATETLRRELNFQKLNIKISGISPGLVNTDFIGANAEGTDIGDAAQNAVNILKPEDVADACLYILSTSPHVQIHDILIRPVGEEI